MKRAILIVGPTAVGKTAAAIGLARQLDTEIISADSRQCYRELDIGVARPSPAELSEIPHHFIASHSILDPLNAGSYEQQSLRVAGEIFERKDSLVVVGGTGLYIRAFCEGLDEVPPADPDVRDEVARGFASGGIQWLQEEIRLKDPAFYERGEIQNPHRLMRALEVVRSTGRSIFSYRKSTPKQRPFSIRKYGMQLPKEVLMQRIRSRVEEMIRKGLVEEVRSLLPYRAAGPLQTVGYAEIFDHLDGKYSLQEAMERIITHTWQYAKRQYTWFRRDPDIEWVDEAEDGWYKKIL